MCLWVEWLFVLAIRSFSEGWDCPYGGLTWIGGEGKGDGGWEDGKNS